MTDCSKLVGYTNTAFTLDPLTRIQGRSDPKSEIKHFCAAFTLECNLA